MYGLLGLHVCTWVALICALQRFCPATRCTGLCQLCHLVELKIVHACLKASLEALSLRR